MPCNVNALHAFDISDAANVSYGSGQKPSRNTRGTNSMRHKPEKPKDYLLTSCGGDIIHLPGGSHKNPLFLPHPELIFKDQPTQEEGKDLTAQDE